MDTRSFGATTVVGPGKFKGLLPEDDMPSSIVGAMSMNEFARLYEEEGPKRLARRLGVTPCAIQRHALKLGLRAKGWRKIDPVKFKAWYEAGVSMQWMASRFGCSLQSLKDARKCLKLSARPTGRPVKSPKPLGLDMRAQDIILLNTPDNPTFDGLLAVVEKVEEWGAHVLVQAWNPAREPIKRPYRASWDEMVRVGKLPARAAGMDGDHPTHTQTVFNGPLTPKTDPDDIRTAREKGYTGRVCPKCGGSKMIQAGKCEQCLDCYESGECS